MTVAMYISPKSVIAPIFITDTLISDELGNAIGPVGTRNRLQGFGISTSQATLLRKTVALEYGALLGFAGSLRQIPDFLEYAQASIGALNSERPLKRLAERANDYPEGEVAILTALPDPDRNRLSKIYHGAVREIEIDGLGFVAAIGSGAEAVIARVRTLHDQLATDYTSDVELASMIALHLSATHLTDEVYTSDERIPPDRRSWGGPLECAFYENDRRWFRGPSWAHFIFQYDLSGSQAPNMIDRAFLYDPGDESGWLHSITRSPDAQRNEVCRIPSVGSYGGDLKVFDWSRWHPEQVRMTLVYGKVYAAEIERLGEYVGFFPPDEFNGVELSTDIVGLVAKPFGDRVEDFLLKGIQAARAAARQHAG